MRRSRVDLHGQKLWSELDARTKTKEIRRRVRYVCEYFFGGDVANFASFLDVHPYWLYNCLRDLKGLRPLIVPTTLLARIVQYTDVRAEWLLCGVGPMLCAPLSVDMPDDYTQTLTLPNKLRSNHALFAGRANFPGPPRPRLPHPVVCTPTAASDDAAQFLFQACSTHRPVVLFSGRDGSKTCRRLLKRLLRQSCVTGLVLTGAAVEFDVPQKPTSDINTILRLGALSGIGLGEAVQRWGGASPGSPISLARTRNIPFAAHVLFGEMATHFAAPVHGAEVGAALGACAYVDLLAITEQFRTVFDHDGVFLVVGDAVRAVDLFMSVYAQAVHDTVPFTIVVVGSRLPDESCTLIHDAGGNVRFLEGDLAQAAEEFRQSCVKVFDGKLHDDEENNTDD